MAYKCTRWLLNRQLGTNRLNWNLRLEQNEKVLLHLSVVEKSSIAWMLVLVSKNW